MNGIVLNKSIQEDPSGSFLEQVKKNEELKKRKNLKLVSIIVLSNIFVASLFYSPEKTIKPHSDVSNYSSHPGHRMMILNIIPTLQLDNNSKERKVTLLNNKKKIVLSLGYLHEELKNDLDPSIRHFKIEIPEHMTLDLGALSEEKLIAIPAVEVNKVSKTKRGSSYEINI
jgi:hypothetical protein